MSVSATSVDISGLCRLCHEGMLFEVQEWIRTGGSVSRPSGRGRLPLVVAAGRGFHSLVALLLECEESCPDKDKALTAAASGGHLETIRLLIEHGADIGKVSAGDVVESAAPDTICFLYEQGVDFETGYPVAQALANKSEHALLLVKNCRGKIPAVAYQAAMALRHFVRDGDEQWVTKLKKAGASPRKRVWQLRPDKHERIEFSALQDAALIGSYRILWRLGVRKTDDLQGMLESACIFMDTAKIKFLISRGALINDQPSGGSTLLEHTLTTLAHGHYFRTPSARDQSDRAWKLANELVDMGARWIPDKSSMRNVRFWICKAEPGRTAAVAKLLLKNGCAPPETVRKLFSTPMIRRHAGDRLERVPAYH